MPKDYRRRTPVKKYSRSAPAPQSSSKKWILFGVMIGLLVAVLYWHYEPVILNKITQKENAHHAILAHKKLAEKKPPSTEVKKAADKSTTPEFDFYTLLAKSSPPPTPTATVIKKPAPVSTPAATPATPTVANVPNSATVVAVNSAAGASVATVVPVVATEPEKKAATPVPPPQPAVPPPAVAEQYVLQVASVKNYSDADSLKAQLTMMGFNVNIQKYVMEGQVWNRVYVSGFSSKEEALKQQNALRENKIHSILIKQP